MPSTILFDARCNLCNASAQFVLARDRAARFRFVPLQSDEGLRLLQRFGLPTDDYDSFVLVDGDRAYLRSGAALRVARRLGGAWALLYPLVILPEALRDGLYDFVAQRRFRWFGHAEGCTVEPPRAGR